LKKLLLIALAVTVGAGLLSAVLPSAPEDREVERLLREQAWTLFGRRLSVGGGIEIQLFPTARITARDVVIEAPEGSGFPALASVTRLEATLDIWGLWNGETVVRDVTLIGPRIVLEVQPDGRRSWQTRAAASSGPQSRVTIADPVGPSPSSGGTVDPRPLPSRTGLGQVPAPRGLATRDEQGDRQGGGNVVALPSVPIVPPSGEVDLPGSIRVEDATVHYRNLARGTMVRVDGLTADAERAPSGGAFRVDATGQWEAVPISLSGIVGLPRPVPEGGRAVLVEVTATSPILPAEVRFHGDVLAEGDSDLRGRVRLAVADPGAVLAALPVDNATLAGGPLVLPGAIGQPLKAEAVIALGGEHLDLSRLSVELGTVTMTGDGRIGFPTVQFGQDVTVGGTLTVRRIDLDRLVALPERTYRWRDASRDSRDRMRAEQRQAGEGSVAIPIDEAGRLASRPERPRPIAGNTTGAGSYDPTLVPAMLNGTVDVVIDQAALHGELAQDIRLQVGLRDGLIGIDRASALLPGGTDITLFGQLSRPAGTGAAVFTGEVQGGSTRLRETLAWLGLTPDVPAGRIMQAEFSAAVEASAAGIQLDALDMLVDNTHAIGRVAWLRRDRTSIDVSLEFDSLNLDPYLVGAPYQAAGASTNPGAAGQVGTSPDSVVARLSDQMRVRADEAVPPLRRSRESSGGGAGVPGLSITRPRSDSPPVVSLTLLEAMDVQVDLRARSVTWRGERSQQVRFAGVLRRGELRLSEARVTGYAGATLTVAGALTNLLGRPRFDGRFNVSAPEAAPLLQSANLPVGDSIGALDLGGSASGELRQLDISARLNLAGLDGSLQGRLIDLESQPRYDFQLDMQHPDMGRFVQGVGLIDSAAPNPMGPLQLTGRAAGTAGGGAVDLRAALFGGEASLVGQIGLAGGLNYSGRLQFRHDDTNRLVANMAPNRPAAAARAGPLQLAGDLAGDLTGFELSGLTATVGDLPVSGQVAIGLARDRPLVLADLETGEIDSALLLASEWVETGGALRRSWPNSSVDFAELRNFEGRLQLRADAITHRGYRLSDASLNAVLSEDLLEVSSLTGRLMGGPMELSGSIQPASAQIDLVAVAQNTRMAARLGRDLGLSLQGGTLAFDLKLGSQGVTLADLVKRLSGSILFEVAGTELFGVDQARLSDGLLELPNPEALTPLVRRSMGGAGRQTSRLDTIAASLAVDDGVVTADQFVFVSEYLEGKIEGTIDLGRLRQDLTVFAALPKHPDAPFFTLSLVGPTADPMRQFDLDLLTRYLFGTASAPATEPSGARSPQDSQPMPPTASAASADPSAPTLAPPGSGTLVPPGSTSPLAGDDRPLPDPDLPPVPPRQPTASASPDPEPTPLAGQPPATVASDSSRPSATVALPPVGDVESGNRAAEGVELGGPRSGDALMQQLMRRSRSGGARNPPVVTMQPPQSGVPSFGPSEARPPTTAEEEPVANGPGPLPIPGQSGLSAPARPEAQASLRERDAPLFRVEPFPEEAPAGAPAAPDRTRSDGPDVSSRTSPSTGGLAPPGSGTLTAPGADRPPQSSPSGQDDGSATAPPVQLAPPGGLSPDGAPLAAPGQLASDESLPPDVDLPAIPLPKPPVPETVRDLVERQRATEPPATAPPARTRGTGQAGGGLSAPGMSLVAPQEAPRPAPSAPANQASPAVPSGGLAPPGASAQPAPDSGTTPRFSEGNGGDDTSRTQSGSGSRLAPPGSGTGPDDAPVGGPLPPSRGNAPVAAPPPLLSDEGAGPFGDLSRGNGSTPSRPVSSGSMVEFGGPPTGGLVPSNRLSFEPTGPDAVDPDVARAIPDGFRVDQGGPGTFFADPNEAAPSEAPAGPVSLPTLPWQKSGGGAAASPSGGATGTGTGPLAQPGTNADSSPGTAAPATRQADEDSSSRPSQPVPAPAPSGGGLSPPGATLGPPGGAL